MNFNITKIIIVIVITLGALVYIKPYIDNIYDGREDLVKNDVKKDKETSKWFGKQVIGVAINYTYDSSRKVTTIETDKNVSIEVYGILIPKREKIYTIVLCKTKKTYVCVPSLDLCKGVL